MQSDIQHASHRERFERAEAASYVGLKPRTLAIWASQTYRRRNEGRTPIPFYKVGSRVYYTRSDLDRYLESCRIE